MILPIQSLRLDFQSPECLMLECVHEYVEAINDGQEIPPVRVYFGGEVYWLADGFHRVAAMQMTGHTEIEAEVVPGTYAEMEAEWSRVLEAIRADFRGSRSSGQAA